MAAFTASEKQYVNDAYTLALDRVAWLTEANSHRESEDRSLAIQQLVDYAETIEQNGFFHQADCTDYERETILDAANHLFMVAGSIEDTHELTITELEADLVQFVQGLGLDVYSGALVREWNKYKRLPKTIPEEVRDEFTTDLFFRTQVFFNSQARKIQPVKDLQCLNAEDYNPVITRFTLRSLAGYAADDTVTNYINLQGLKAQVANKGSKYGLAGDVWGIVGWDSFSDFATDVIVAGVFGPYGYVRWAKRLQKAKKRLEKAEKARERFQDIESRIKKIEERAADIKEAAEKIKKARAIAETPAKVQKVFDAIVRAKNHLEIIQRIGGSVKPDYIRGVASSILAGFVPTSSSTDPAPKIGGQFTEEAARRAFYLYFDNTAVGHTYLKWRAELRVSRVIFRPENETYREMFAAMFWLTVAREFTFRLGLAFLNKVQVNWEVFFDEFIASIGAAVESMLRDDPIFKRYNLSFVSEAIASAARKYAVSLIQKLFK